MVAIFSLPHPCAIRFPGSLNRQTPTSPISSAFSGRYSVFSHFTSFSCCVSRCVSPLCLPGVAIATAHRPDRSEQWSCGGEQFQAPPRWDTTERHNRRHRFRSSNRPISTNPISFAFSGRNFSWAPMPFDFPSQIVKSPQVLSHLLLVVAFFPLPHPCAKWLRIKPMRWDFFMGYRCYSPNTCVMWTYPKSALTPISCVQTVAYSIKNHKPWECKNLMQVSFKWLIEPHEIGVWHLQRAKTILDSWDRKLKKLDPPTTPISPVLSIYWL